MDSTFNERMQAFENHLSALQNQCSEAEKACIVAETNIKSLGERQAQLVEECENLAGCPIDRVPEYLASEEQVIKEIMARLDGIDISGELTQETMEAINAIVADYSVA